MTYHPHFETAKQAQRRHFEEEIERHLERCEEQRRELDNRRVIETLH